MNFFENDSLSKYYLNSEAVFFILIALVVVTLASLVFKKYCQNKKALRSLSKIGNDINELEKNYKDSVMQVCDKYDIQDYTPAKDVDDIQFEIEKKKKEIDYSVNVQEDFNKLNNEYDLIKDRQKMFSDFFKNLIKSNNSLIGKIALNLDKSNFSQMYKFFNGLESK